MLTKVFLNAKLIQCLACILGYPCSFSLFQKRGEKIYLCKYGLDCKLQKKTQN